MGSRLFRGLQTKEGGWVMKKIVIILVLCLVPSLASAVNLEKEEAVLTALEAIRTALDTEIEEPVDETMSKLISDVKTAIETYRKSKRSDEMFIAKAEKSLQYFGNIARTVKMGVAPFDADRKQADNNLDEAHKIHRDNLRQAK
jgi:type II secretory pathway pseudopilin PulG